MTNVSIAIYGWLRGLLASAQEERGQDLVEYAVLVGFIGIALAIAFIAFTPDMNAMAGAVQNCVNIPADPYVCP